jgi:hypothetical protein
MKKLLGLVTGLALVIAVVAPAVAADRNLAPTRTISGAASELQWVGDIGVGPDGTVTGSSAYWGAQFAYAPTAGADATWSRKINGSKTGLSEPAAVSVDALGRVWTSMNGMSPYSIGLFAATANGNAAPLKTIGGTNTGLTQVGGIAVGPNGDVYVIEQSTDSILVFDSQAGGNAEPKRVIGGFNTSLSSPSDLEVDSAGTLYVAEQAAEMVLAFAPGANGNVNPARLISGPATTLTGPGSLAVDSGRNLYVGDSGETAVAVFKSTANGNTAPITRLVGLTTQLGSVGAVDVGIDRRVYVMDWFNDAVRVYPALVPLQKPGAVQSLAISGTASSAYRAITWAPPVTNLNAGAITGYKVVIKKGTKIVGSKTTTASVRSMTVARSTLKAGTFTATVTAINKQGSSPAKTITFVFS